MDIRAKKPEEMESEELVPLTPGLIRQYKGQHQPGIRSIQMAKIRSSTRGPGRLALAWIAFVAGATSLLALLALSLPCHCHSEGLDVAGRSHGRMGVR